MNHLGDAYLRAWTLRFMVLLAADLREQLVRVGGRELDTESVVEEVGLLCRLSEGLTERGVFAPHEVGDLQAIGRCLGELDADSRAGLWADALATDPPGPTSVLSPGIFSSRC
jgi:hypothetical protein